MTSKILVAVDGSEHAWKALDLAADFAQLHDAEVLVLHVLPYEPLPDALRAFAAAEHLPIEEENARYHYSRTFGDGLTRSAEKRLRAKGITKVDGRTAEGRPADTILDIARGEAVDLIMLGSRGLSDARGLLLGSISHKVANHAPCTCVTVK